MSQLVRLARQVGVALKLTFPGEPDFAAKNVELLASYASRNIDVNGEQVPLLLAKPTARTAHVGGEVLSPNGPEAKLLASFVQKLNSPPQCKESPPDAAEVALSGLTLASPKQTYARAKFMLAGEVATPEELDGLGDDEAMLDAQLDKLMTGDAFLSRAQEMFADWLLTDAYSSLVRGDDLFPQLRDYPQRSFYQPLCTPERNFRCCFFQKHGQRLLVFNGVDNATVSHDVGPRVAFTGSTRDGLPTLSGLVAGLQGQDMPLAMFVSGGFASTGGLVPITRGGSLQLLRNLASPNRDGIHAQAVDVALGEATRARDERLIAATSSPRANKAYSKLLGFRSGPIEDRFREIADVLQAASETRAPGGFADAASGMLALMRSGATAAGHLSTAGFDTHDNHDDLNNGHRPALQRLLTGLDYIIDTAAADPMLSARGVLIIVASDFGRTTYNDGGGKDHWPITSMMAIGIGPTLEPLIGGARVIGATTPDGGTNGVTALPVKVAEGKTVLADAGDPMAFKLTPAHVNLALRRAIGLCESDAPTDPLKRFRLNVSPQEPIPLG